VTYQFEPGAEADGVTVHLPLPVLARVRPEGFDWLVPGLQLELATALIRTLPKPVRVQLVPAPDVARDVVAWIDAHYASWEDTVRAGDLAPSFHDAFADAVRALRGVEVPPDAWDDERLPAHLRMTFRVHEERGASSVMVDQSSDLVALQRRLSAQSQRAVSSAVRDAVRTAMREAGQEGARVAGGAGDGGGVGAGAGSGASATADGAAGARAGAGAAVSSASASASASSPNLAGGTPPGAGPQASAASAPPTPPTDLERSDLRTWPSDLPDGRIPEEVSTVVGGLTVRGFPALVVDGPLGARPRPVALRVLADSAGVAETHAAGVRELLLTELALATARITTRWTGAQALTLGSSPYRSTDALVTDLQRAAVGALLEDEPARSLGGAHLRDAVAYASVRAAARDALEDKTFRLAGDVAAVLTAAREVDADLRAATSLALLATVTDVRDQVARLTAEGFVSRAGAARLPHLVRYLRAARHRLTRAAADPSRDASLAWQVRELEEEHAAAAAAARGARPDLARDARLAEAAWMIEELRVSLFAQQLGTAHPVSAKRIRSALSATSAAAPAQAPARAGG
jgi:ATP-dependent helicase HrpA